MQCRPQMPGAGCRQQGFAVARVQHQMIDDLPEEMRPIAAPVCARAIAVEDPCPFTGRNQKHGLAAPVAAPCFGGTCGTLRFACAGFLDGCHSLPPGKCRGQLDQSVSTQQEEIHAGSFSKPASTRSLKAPALNTC